LPEGDELKTRTTGLDEVPRDVLDAALHDRDSRVDVILLEMQPIPGREKDALEWVVGWEEAISRGGPSYRARAPRLAVVGIGFDADFRGSLENRGVFVVDQGRAGFSEDPETAARQRLHQILIGGAQSRLQLDSILPNPFGPAGGPSPSEADPAYETMPVPDLAAYDLFIDWLRRGHQSDSN
jgi:hypothetical protein